MSVKKEEKEKNVRLNKLFGLKMQNKIHFNGELFDGHCSTW